MKNANIIKQLKNTLGDNLCAVLGTGSLLGDGFVKGWSDIDMIVVVEDMKIDVLLDLALFMREIEKQYQCCVGFDVVTKNDISRSKDFLYKNEGKVIQAVHEQNIFKKNLLYAKSNLLELATLTDAQLRQHSWETIQFFRLVNRKYVLSRYLEGDILDVLRKQIRHAFNLTKFCIQFSTMRTYCSKSEILKQAANIFRDYNFDTLDKDLGLIRQWQNIHLEQDEYHKMMQDNLHYIESFSNYIDKLYE